MINNKTVLIAEAIMSLEPGAQFTIFENDYSTIKWLSPEVIQPSEEAVNDEVLRLQQEHDNSFYKVLRAAAYPPMSDYLDGIVKGDQDQIDAYIAECLAVKEKYPKPSES